MNRMFIVTLFSILIASAAFAGSPAAEVQLMLDESSVLPGTPTGLTVLVTNRGDETLELPAALWLTATNPAGQTFTLRKFSFSDEIASVVPEQVRIIPSGTSRELRFDPIVFMVGSPWLMDQRLSAPGQYRLQVVFAPAMKGDGTFDAAKSISSKPELFTVSTPSGEDAAVWHWMQEHKWEERAWLTRPNEFASFVMKNHPQSQYALFAAVFLPRHSDEPMRTNEPTPMLLEQVKRFPNKAFTDQVKLLLIQYYQQALDFASRSYIYRAADDSDAARALARELIQESRSSNVRASAKDLVDRIPTREQLLKKPETR